MLLRIGGGSSGIKEYLERGQKAGREHTRDEMDKRLALHGDLDITDAIIQRMDKEGQRYIHLTLSFLEDDIPEETLRAITADFEQFAFAAHDKAEYEFYAEAHLPKIKSYINQKTGEIVERKPHIHIVIPTQNQVSKQGLHPLGYEKQNEKFIDAFQEHINNKYGLVSPKDRRRIEFNDASDLISRYTADTFNPHLRELREAIFNDVLERRIETIEGFEALLSEYGKARFVEGKHGDYYNLKADGKAKGINLKDAKFSRAFIELPTAEKLALLKAELQAERLEAGAARPTPQQIADTLSEWHALRAQEVRFINSGNRKLYAAYQASTREERLAILDAQKAAYNERFLKESPYDDRGTGSPLADYLRAADEDLRAAGQFIDEAGQRLSTLTEVERAKRNLADRSIARAVAAAVQGYGRDQEQATGKDLTHDQQAQAVQPVTRGADSVVDHLLREAKERQLQERATSDEWTEIKRTLDGARLLAHVSKTHGVHPEKYEVTKGKDGSDRIKCGTKNYTVSDFLTKELHLSWKDAQPLLRECYELQKADVAIEVRQAPKSGLWRDFQAWRGSDWQAEKKTAWEVQKQAERVRFADIKASFAKDRAAVYASIDARKYAERRAALSVVRMQRVEKEKAARQQKDIERAALKARLNLRPADLYRIWLARQAERGNDAALRELRRQQHRAPATLPKEANAVAPASAQSAVRDAETIKAERITYTVSDRGDVTYKRDGKAFLRDEARAVILLESTKDNIETALRLSMQKFGNSLHINGGEDFRRRVVEVAVERGVHVDFKNEGLNDYKRYLEEQEQLKLKVHQPVTEKEKGNVTTPPEKVKADDVLSSIAEKRKGMLKESSAQLERKRLEAERLQREQAQQNRKGPNYEPGF